MVKATFDAEKKQYNEQDTFSDTRLYRLNYIYLFIHSFSPTIDVFSSTTAVF